ncbi:MAG: glycosyltransferase family 39 protein, partial [Verrucomicrobiota bacterium]
LDLSYYSKPPMIAWLQFAGTSLWGDTELGVRFFSPVIGAVLGCLMLRFFARESSARTGFFFLLIITATPLLSVGSVLLTIDAPSVLFWTAATLAGWRAVQPEGKTSDWAWTGLWMGLGFLSKYTELFQLLCWIVFFWLCRPARAHLRRPGPWLALAINFACTAPVLVWNAQRHWVTVTHVAERAGAGHGWKPADALRYFTEFIGGETGVLNPVFFIAAIWAAIAFWRRFRNDARLVFLFSMSAPLFLAYLLWSFRSRTLPNWIVPSVIPAYSLMTFYWETRWREGVRAVRTWWISGLAVGLVMVVFLHNFDLTKTFTGRPVPSTLDPTGRLKGAPAMAAVVDQARQTLSLEGKPVFVIGDHYATSGLLSFYLPEARTNNFDRPLVYYRTSETPDNQFYFWPGYREQRRGENALFIRQVGLPSLKPGWYQDWRHGGTNLWNAPQLRPAPEILFKEFDSVTNLGLYPVLYRGRLYHTVQIFECRNLK